VDSTRKETGRPLAACLRGDSLRGTGSLKPS
jgi:hypothetical protein